MRPTWHFVTSTDIRWILELTAPRVHRTISHYCRRLGLDRTAVHTRGEHLRARAGWTGTHARRISRTPRTRGPAREGNPARDAHDLRGARSRDLQRTPSRQRSDLRPARRARTDTRSGCHATRRLPSSPARFFRSHGPATMRDFVWWSGLTMVDTKRGLEMNRAKSVVVDGCTYWTVGNTPRPGKSGANAHLLPIYDEYPRVVSRSLCRPTWADGREVTFARVGDVPARAGDCGPGCRHMANAEDG